MLRLFGTTLKIQGFKGLNLEECYLVLFKTPNIKSPHLTTRLSFCNVEDVYLSSGE